MPDTRLWDELRALITRHGSEDAAPVPALPGVRLIAITRAMAAIPHVCEPSLALVAQGAQRLGVGEHELRCGVGQYLLVPVDLPMEVQVIRPSPQQPFLGFGLRLVPAAIASLLLEGGAAPPAGAPRPQAPSLCASPVTPDLVEPIVRLLRLLDRPRDLPVLAPAIEREILWRLLQGEQGGLLRQIGLADGRLTRVARAIRWLRQHHAEPVRIETLAALAGMSATAFHLHFRQATSLTPIQYQKQLRLQAARVRLAAGGEDVVQVGLAVGYDSASQFSREYRRAFGLPPGEDRRRLRAVAPG